MLALCQRVAESTGPFGPGALVDLSRIGSAANYCGKWLLLIEWNDMPQAQGLVRAFESAVLSHPPSNQLEQHARRPAPARPGNGKDSNDCWLPARSERPASTRRDEIVADHHAAPHHELDPLHLGYVDGRVARNCDYIGELAFLD